MCLLQAMDTIASELDKGLIIDLMNTTVPEVADGSVEVVSVAREPGVAAKVRVKMRQLSSRSALAVCVGRGGCRVHRLRQLLNGETVVFVDADAPMVQQISQALRPAEICAGAICARTNGSYAILAPPETAKRLIGHRGTNIRLASRLVGCELAVVQ